MKPLLTIKNLTSSAGGKKILRSFSLVVYPGELHVLMGTNGSGKSTLALSLMGHPTYTVRAEKLTFAGRNLINASPDERARAGLMLAFQNPLSISGVSMATLLPEAIRAVDQNTPRRAAAQNNRGIPKKQSTKQHLTLASFETARKKLDLADLQQRIAETAAELGFSDENLNRNLNEDFSGGEKKKSEIIQLAALRPKLAILDEPDSGLDVDALKKISTTISRLRASGTAIVLITHNPRIVRFLKPDAVHILHSGTISQTGPSALARTVEKQGFASMNQRKKHGKNRNT